ncbi:MAG TPA: hypothetical protein ENJ82_00505 [Bacteroidetes bacterium]|nr:hypothetical protein [Bacteroidota bacterium]
MKFAALILSILLLSSTVFSQNILSATANAVIPAKAIAQLPAALSFPCQFAINQKPDLAFSPEQEAYAFRLTSDPIDHLLKLRINAGPHSVHLTLKNTSGKPYAIQEGLQVDQEITFDFALWPDGEYELKIYSQEQTLLSSFLIRKERTVLL